MQERTVQDIKSTADRTTLYLQIFAVIIIFRDSLSPMVVSFHAILIPGVGILPGLSYHVVFLHGLDNFGADTLGQFVQGIRIKGA